jgi:hypothetical protein
MEQKEHEKELLRKAHQQREQRDFDEFTEMSSKILVGAVAGGETYQYSDLKKMLKRLREPFKTAIEGHAISLAESDAAIMMKDSALEVIIEKVLVRERPNEDGTTSQK